MSVRVRFAPSPTGLLHIGGVRTALFNWLFARHEGGEFLLRIENTDTSREVEESVEQIQRSLRWLGLDWDGRGRRSSSTRSTRHAEAARLLLAEGKAYEDEGAIRFRMPDEGTTALGGRDQGTDRPTRTRSSRTSCSCARDGRPTYNFAARARRRRLGHHARDPRRGPRSNTPKQIRILEALGRPVPVYAHVPNVFGTDGRKLSKRHGAVSVEEFRAQGYLASALMNYLALLGWSYDDRTTVMSRDELVERFSLDRVGSSPATFDYAKLDWLNGVYLRELPPEEYADTLVAYLREPGLRGRRGDDPRFGAARPGEDLATRASIRASRASSSAASSRLPSCSTAPAGPASRRGRRSPASSPSPRSRSRRRCAGWRSAWN